MQDSIEKIFDLEAPIARVWRAVTDHKQFGEWFRVDLDGPFVVGEVSTGRMTHPGCEHMAWQATVLAMEAKNYFSYSWCPYADPGDAAPQTLVEFRLEETDSGTRLHIKESGFSKLPSDEHRQDALRNNTRGWDEQTKNITAYVNA